MTHEDGTTTLCQNVSHYLPSDKAWSVSWRAKLHRRKNLEVCKDEVKLGCHLSSAVEGVLEILSEYAFDSITHTKHTL